VSEEFRRRTIRLKLSQTTTRPASVLPTPFPSLDAALGLGGLPGGSIVELFGPAACGKTTLALQIVAHVALRDRAAAWLDAEGTFDPAFAASLGVNLERVPVLQPSCAEQALDMAVRLVSTGALDLLVVDSAAALVPQLELESGLGETGAGLQGRVLASGLRRLRHAVERRGVSVLFLNQERTRLASTGEEADTSAGGAALKLHAAVRIALSPVANRRLRFRVLKNRLSAPFSTGELAWESCGGFVECP
jgi:recombination protein RecA